MRIPHLTLTSGQQGGIGYPPSIARAKGRWYAISDSRDAKPPKLLEDHLWYQRQLKPYGQKRDPYWHTQSWVFKKWHSAPSLTWAELVKLCAVA